MSWIDEDDAAPVPRAPLRRPGGLFVAQLVGLVLGVAALVALAAFHAPPWLYLLLLFPVVSWLGFRRRLRTRHATPGEVCPICGRLASDHTDDALIAHVIEARGRRT